MSDEQIKTGWKSSEFWALAAGTAVTLLNEAFGWEIPKEAIVMIASTIAAYIIGRSAVKALAK